MDREGQRTTTEANEGQRKLDFDGKIQISKKDIKIRRCEEKGKKKIKRDKERYGNTETNRERPKDVKTAEKKIQTNFNQNHDISPEFDASN